MGSIGKLALLYISFWVAHLVLFYLDQTLVGYGANWSLAFQAGYFMRYAFFAGLAYWLLGTKLGPVWTAAVCGVALCAHSALVITVTRIAHPQGTLDWLAVGSYLARSFAVAFSAVSLYTIVTSRVLEARQRPSPRVWP